jgi:hypothetical protein
MTLRFHKLTIQIVFSRKYFWDNYQLSCKKYFHKTFCIYLTLKHVNSSGFFFFSEKFYFGLYTYKLFNRFYIENILPLQDYISIYYMYNIYIMFMIIYYIIKLSSCHDIKYFHLDLSFDLFF